MGIDYSDFCQWTSTGTSRRAESVSVRTVNVHCRGAVEKAISNHTAPDVHYLRIRLISVSLSGQRKWCVSLGSGGLPIPLLGSNVPVDCLKSRVEQF